MNVDILQLGSFVVVGACLAMIGQGITKAVFGGQPKRLAKGWRKTFYVTMWLHPIIGGALLGVFADLPSPDFLDDSFWGKVMWYGLAGGFAPSLYNAVSSWAKAAAVRDRHDDA